MSISHFIFSMIVDDLQSIAISTKLSYAEVNIIIYYILIPFTWIVLLDFIFKFHYLKITFITVLAILLLSVNFSEFSLWLFKKSVLLLNYPNTVDVSGITLTHIPPSIDGKTYIYNSLFACILFPIIIYIAIYIFFLIYRKYTLKKSIDLTLRIIGTLIILSFPFVFIIIAGIIIGLGFPP